MLDILYRLIEYIAQVKKKSVVVTILPPWADRLGESLGLGVPGGCSGERKCRVSDRAKRSKPTSIEVPCDQGNEEQQWVELGSQILGRRLKRCVVATKSLGDRGQTPKTPYGPPQGLTA